MRKMVESEDIKKLRKILSSIEDEARASLELADDMKVVHQSQAKIQIVKEITTHFFAEKKPPHEHRTLRI
jgi:hypothetical protein